MIVAAVKRSEIAAEPCSRPLFVALIGEALPLMNILLQWSCGGMTATTGALLFFAPLQQRHGTPFQVVVRLILAQDGEAQAMMKAQRAGIEPEYATANGQPGLRGFLLDTLDQHGSDSLPLEIRVDGDINQLQFAVTGRYP